MLLETSAGDIVIDLLVDYASKECEKYVPSYHQSAYLGRCYLISDDIS